MKKAVLLVTVVFLAACGKEVTGPVPDYPLGEMNEAELAIAYQVEELAGLKKDPPERPKSYFLRGDANFDGVLTEADVAIFKAQIKDPSTTRCAAVFDVNVDSHVNNDDWGFFNAGMQHYLRGGDLPEPWRSHLEIPRERCKKVIR